MRVFVPEELADIQPDMKRFFEAMVYKLRKNRHKGRWENIDLNKGFELLYREVEELKKAIEEGSTFEVILEAADVANFAMILSAIALEKREDDQQSA